MSAAGSIASGRWIGSRLRRRRLGYFRCCGAGQNGAVCRWWGVFERLRAHRQEQVMGELGLIGARATDSHTTGFTAGYRGAIGQRHRSVATTPADHQSAGRGSILEAPRQQGCFFVSGSEPIAENRSVSGGIGHPRSQPRTVFSRRRIPAGYIRRSRQPAESASSPLLRQTRART